MAAGNGEDPKIERKLKRSEWIQQCIDIYSFRETNDEELARLSLEEAIIFVVKKRKGVNMGLLVKLLGDVSDDEALIKATAWRMSADQKIRFDTDMQIEIINPKEKTM